MSFVFVLNAAGVLLDQDLDQTRPEQNRTQRNGTERNWAELLNWTELNKLFITCTYI